MAKREPAPMRELHVSLAVPDGWHLLPRASLLGRVDAAHFHPLLPVMSGLATNAEAAGVAVCAFGPLPSPDGGQFGASCVLAVRGGIAPGEMTTAAERIAAADPGAAPREEICWLEGAGAAGRLAWTPETGPEGQRSSCVEFYVPFPGDDRRVAILACSAVAVTPSRAVFDHLDSLAGTLCFMTSESTPQAPAVGNRS